jgi:hypothetical protein
MKTFKKYDFIIQVLLILGFTVASFIRMDHTFIVGYFVVGAWQIISMIGHYFTNCLDEKGTIRYSYHWVTLIVVSTMLIGFIIPFFLFIFWIMLFAAPFMACYYAWLCYDEVFHKMQRPLYQLK